MFRNKFGMIKHQQLKDCEVFLNGHWITLLNIIGVSLLIRLVGSQDCNLTCRNFVKSIQLNIVLL